MQRILQNIYQTCQFFSIKTTTSNNHLSLVNNIITNHLNIAIVTSVSLYNWPIFNYCKYLIQFILRFQYGRQHEFWRRQSCSLFHSSITSKSQLMSVMKNLSQSQHCVPLHSIPVYSKGDNSNIKNWSAIFVVDTCGLHPC